MILWEGVIEITGENDTSTVDEDVKLWLVFLFTFLLVESGLSTLSLLTVVNINELVFDSFNKVLYIRNRS